MLFFAIEFALLIAPLLILFLLRPGKASNHQAKIAASTALAIFCLTLAAFLLKISFSYSEANAYWLLVCYVAYCSLAVMALRIGNKLIKWMTTVIAMTPIVLGYPLATFGSLGILFITSDFTQPISHSENMGGNLHCVVRAWGGAWADGGYQANLDQPLFLGLQRVMAAVTIDQNTDTTWWSTGGDEPAPIEEKELCHQLLLHYQAAKAG